MPFAPGEIEVIKPWPPRQPGGMDVGMGHPGCRLVHVPTGSAVECVHLRTQHQNYQRALVLLELLVEA